MQRHIILYMVLAVLAMVACTGGGTAAGGSAGFEQELELARSYTYPSDTLNLDTAHRMGLALLEHDSVGANVANRMKVLRLLTDVARMGLDYEELLKWATQLATLCRENNQPTEALRTESEIGTVLTHLGQRKEGMAMLDRAISQLEPRRSFSEFDACTIAMKRKLTALILLPPVVLAGDTTTVAGRYAGIIALADRFVARLNDYEQHPGDYADGSARQPAAGEVAGYCSFYRTQAYAFLAQAYATLGQKDQARHYLALFEQSDYGKTLNGRSAVTETQRMLGDYDKILATYDEIEKIGGGDTLNPNYVRQLRGRAIAAEARGDHAASQHYWLRHSILSEAVNDQLQASQAQDYAARYHNQELEMALREVQVTHLKNLMINVIVGMVTFFIAALAVYAFRQRRLLRQKNRILIGQVTDAMKYKQLYERLKIHHKSAAGTTPAELPDLSSLSDTELFEYINDVVRHEQLFITTICDRQALVERFHLSEKRIGAAFSKGSPFKSLASYVRDTRLEYACMLLHENPTMTISEVASASGFPSYARFATDFKNKYSVSPTEFREQSRA
ncbi:MAG: helix-turn-helix domain-containing protein [Prevotella sp.]|nr:helix-turn-helix domain-containing protein [Prevotella sp.]